MKTALVIMAAGIGSRFGGGIKQLAAVGPNGEIIMDYSIHDAIEAGFDKIVFIIRHDIEEAFKEAIGDRIEKICAGLGVEIDYAFQALENVPEGFSVPEGRSKPWGTGQAVLACKGIIKEPFAVINADDYYGKEAFVRLHDFLQGYTPDKPGDLAMAGFVLKNTLSDNGAVTRGICQMNDAHYLTGVLETGGIEKTADGAAAGGKSIDIDSLVSMNMWALTPEFVDLLESGFVEFFEKAAPANPLKAEYLLPIYIDELLHADKVSVKVLPTHDKWFGVTYAEDKQIVIDSFAKLVADGVIPQALSFAGAADLTTYINDVVTPFISSAAYAPYIAPVAGLGNLNILGLIRFSIYQEGNGWFLLPILSVVSQIFMQKLTMNNTAMDPSQAGSQKMMIYVMTFMSLYFCASYNSAFALYWVVSNIYAIVEQICFNKYFEQQDRKAAKAEEVGI